MSESQVNLKGVPWEVLRTEFTRRKRERTKKLGPRSALKLLRKCLGCGKKFSARDMRSHKCKINYHARIGWKYDAKTKRYVPPNDWVYEPTTRRYLSPVA